MKKSIIKILLIIFITFIFNNISNAENIKCFNKENYFSYFYINGILAGYDLNSNKFDENVSQSSLNLIKEKFEIKKITYISNNTEGLFKDIKQVFEQVDLEQMVKLLSDKRKKEVLLEQQKDYSSIQDSMNYLSSLTKDKQNILFAHSQGNLFANMMCDLKEPDVKLEIIAIAPPTEILKCNRNQTYALFKNDLVINSLNTKEELKNILKSQAVERKHLPYTHDNSWISKIKLNHTVNEYLQNDKVVSDLNQSLDKTKTQVYNEYSLKTLYTFEIVDKNLYQKTKDTISNLSLNTDLWIREKKAFINSLNYGRTVASSMIIGFSSAKYQDTLKKILDTPIPASNEQEFMDMIVYSMNNLSHYCLNQGYTNQAMKKLCLSFKNSDYFKSKNVDTDYMPFLDIYNNQDQKIFFNCAGIISFTDEKSEPLNMYLNYYHNYYPKVSLNNELLDIDYATQNSDEKNLYKIQKNLLGSISFIKNTTDSSYSLSYKHINQVLETNNTDILSKEDFEKCNTLNKLGSKSCDYLIQKITKKYL